MAVPRYERLDPAGQADLLIHEAEANAQHISFDVFTQSWDASVGTWGFIVAAAAVKNGYLFNSTNAINNYIAWYEWMSQGTWQLSVCCRKSAGSGIITPRVDGINYPAFDLY